MTAVDTDLAARHAAESHERYLGQLLELLAIPSVSTQPEHADDCQRAATWIAQDLERIGMDEVRIEQTPGHPLVTARWLHAGPDAPTVLIYGHYDVQPPDPLDEWRTPPFEPTLRDGAVYARGASDDKGQMLGHIKAIESLLAAEGRLPLNVKLVLEGEEESGSNHLEPFLQSHADRLSADVALVSDTHMLAPDTPTLVVSLRGMTYCEIVVDGPSHDLHSGTYGGAVRNPAEALATIVAGMRAPDGSVAIPGFYDRVRELTPRDREQIAELPYDREELCARIGIDEPSTEQGYSVEEARGARPTLEVNGLVSGYGGAGAKTIIPARAMAKVSMRLVADQDHEEIARLFERRVRELAPSGVRVTVNVMHGTNPSHVEVDAPAMAAAARALERVFGRPPLLMREGGSIPVVGAFDRLLGMSTVLMGFGLPDDGLHSPNEKFSVTQFARGIDASIQWMREFARG